MATVSKELKAAIKRKRGELNISVVELARQTGVSRWTLAKIIKGKTDNIQPITASKLNEWLYKQM
ncbi:helix-turn-helix domain-containing protein [Weissella paramesenteroides]|uniref:helix-turn-helix domain-containing protein n=1 Tax=Weissella paramesenteroides TaxID=1249 RepID=UPI00123B4303|nr:helix-turn-helix transcriptional regulator [Weissella paramesenteroides]KAA8457463.1 helix-turn-helix transcriptional regulator [Weissella paramesenteroides]KAA8458926.1 helix-turn-helix transcriptional regulator [Weissella paramesenteroides]KAA8460601.1 helix-turn-helix transcriptional regulator [Weissella paramesenteroides]KAA8460856.1 helix-turn-helix transcriptional regulator [Weissella paramesenteroides]KAA8462609.1 helix-turn-helix transcriptional regulator [Weissella paramesenteroide